MPPIDPAARRAAFRELHQSGCFVIPNPWDAGSARYLAHLGFRALATTSSGYAFSQGLPDKESAVTRDRMLSNIAQIVASVDLPVNADFQSGYARDSVQVAENAALCAATGVAGLSIEDSTGDPSHPLYDLALAIERIRAARSALDPAVLLTARAECYLVNHSNPLRESIRRLTAYAEAGADVLYAPGPTSREDIQAIVESVHPKPVNILMGANTGLKLSDLAALGVRRVSVGSALAGAAWTGFIRAARSIAENGSFETFEGQVSAGDLNRFFEQP